MSKKQAGWAVLGVALLAEAFADRAVSKAAAAVGVSGLALLCLGMLASAAVAAVEG